jgi:hypothetical protein
MKGGGERRVCEEFMRGVCGKECREEEMREGGERRE